MNSQINEKDFVEANVTCLDANELSNQAFPKHEVLRLDFRHINGGEVQGLSKNETHSGSHQKLFELHTQDTMTCQKKDEYCYVSGNNETWSSSQSIDSSVNMQLLVELDQRDPRVRQLQHRKKEMATH